MNNGSRIKDFEETNSKRFSGIEAGLRDLDQFARRPVDYYEKIAESSESIRNAV
jgi:hypothetical protein